MESPKDLITREVSLAGKPTSTSALVEQLEERRITPDRQLPPMRFLFAFNGTPCLPKCELVADTGKAKSGKTLFMSMIMAESLAPAPSAGEEGSKCPNPSLQRVEDKPLRVLWYDTEQSEQSTQDILVNRIMPMSGGQAENLVALNVRGMGYEKRRELLPAAIAHYRPDLVILDGIKDLLLDINDATQASQTVEDLMRWAQHYECCIVSVLHQNKSEADRNMRGSIGTELTNKAFEVFCCDLLADKDSNRDIFRVEHYMSRKEKARRQFFYTLTDQGLPAACQKPAEQPRDERGRWATAKPPATVAMVPGMKWASFNQRYIVGSDGTYSWNLRLLFQEAMEGRLQRPFRDVMAAAMRLSHIGDRSYYYQRFSEAVAQGIIRKEEAADTGQQYVVLCENELPF